jgi:hypothetical protein
MCENNLTQFSFQKVNIILNRLFIESRLVAPGKKHHMRIQIHNIAGNFGKSDSELTSSKPKQHVKQGRSVYCPCAKTRKRNLFALSAKDSPVQNIRVICVCSAMIIRSEFCTLHFYFLTDLVQRKYCDSLDLNQDIRFRSAACAFIFCVVKMYD